MSADQYAGTCCCINRRWGIFLLAVAVFLSACWDALYWVIFENVTVHSKVVGCTGSQCEDMLSCAGTKSFTLHLVGATQIILGAFCGYVGFAGAWTSSWFGVKVFTWYLFFLGAILLLTLAGDWFFLNFCDQYPYRVIESTLGWPGDIPIHRDVKTMMSEWGTYDVSKTNHHAGFDLMIPYTVINIVSALLVLYWAWAAQMLVDILRQGPAFLGPCFNMNAWHADIKGELSQSYVNTSDGPRRMFDKLWRPNMKTQMYGSVTHGDDNEYSI